jgi:hypothetical protein
MCRLTSKRRINGQSRIAQERRHDLTDRVVVYVVVVSGYEDAHDEIDDGEQAGPAASIHAR